MTEYWHGAPFGENKHVACRVCMQKNVHESHLGQPVLYVRTCLNLAVTVYQRDGNLLMSLCGVS